MLSQKWDLIKFRIHSLCNNIPQCWHYFLLKPWILLLPDSIAWRRVNQRQIPGQEFFEVLDVFGNAWIEVLAQIKSLSILPDEYGECYVFHLS